MMKKIKKSRISVVIIGLCVLLLAVATVLMINNCGEREEYVLIENEKIGEYTKNNAYEDDTQKAFVEAALSLVGKVNYFWGGKSSAIGWDPQWGEPTLVENDGSETSGTIQPFGLDCSGYVSWCFIQTGATPQQMSQSIGEGTWNQWKKSEEIEKSEAELGDIVFVNRYPGTKGNHVGIVVAFDENGEPLIAHCTPTYNNVVVSNCGGQFIYFRRAQFRTEQ